MFAKRNLEHVSSLDTLAETAGRRSELPDRSECRRIRQRARISAAEVAQSIGVTEAAVLSWEKGIRNPLGKNLDRYIEALRLMRSCV
jgi:DNA-binding transcriptional regulator YiaG